MPLPSTQDLDPRFSVFLNPIRDLTKNWEVDIAKYLEEYLEDLAEIQITFDNGATTMNFVEAAMLIQGTATVYSKKVEFLWQMVLQMLELLSSKRKLDNNDGGDGAGTGTVANAGGKNKASQMDESVDFQRLDGIGEGRNITLKEDEEDELDEFGRKKLFAFLPATPLHLVEKESEKSKNRVNLFLNNMETIGGKDDFRLNRSYMTPSGLLCLDLPAELLLQEQQQIVTAHMANIEDMAAATDGDGGDAGDCAHQENTSLTPPCSPPPCSPPPLPDHDHDAPELDLPPLPALEAETDPVIEQPIDIKRNGLRRRATAEDIADAPIRLVERWQPMDPHQQVASPRPLRAGRIRRHLPCACHNAPPERARKRTKGGTDVKINGTGKLLAIDQHILKHLPDMDNNNINVADLVAASRGDIHTTLRDKVLEEETNRLALLKQINARGAGNAPQTMAEAFLQHAEAPTDDADDWPHAADHLSDGEDYGSEAAGALDLPDPHTGMLDDDGGGGPAGPNTATAALNDTLQYEPDGEYEALVQKWVAEYIVNAQDYIASSDLTRRVNRWRNRVAPVLVLEEARQSFDIHKYGSQILDAFPEDGTGQLIPFRAIVADQPRKEVARLFLSSLMLTNTYNVEPVQTEKGDLVMDCFSLRLLTRVRHHEQMQEYVAPSQHNTAAETIGQRRPTAGAASIGRKHARVPQRREKACKSKGKGRNKRPTPPSTSETDSDSSIEECIPRSGSSSRGNNNNNSGGVTNCLSEPLDVVKIGGIIEGLDAGGVTASVNDTRSLNELSLLPPQD
uniref:Condensin-2 complex subunit H2-like isoform X1 n=3 Tax=Hirondellea gigas TaxID=1518452 RepID=A0A6A7FVC2_9CRUS